MLKLVYAYFILLFVTCGRSVGKVEIEILYESLCPDSLTFLSEQFYPLWPEIAHYVNVNFVPFGNSESDISGSTFRCQHGPKECAGNKLMSCGLKSTHDQNLQVEFVNCFMDEFDKRIYDTEVIGQACSARASLNWDYINHCFNSQEGINLQLLAEQETRKYSPSFIPTIVYNGVFNQEAQDKSIENFKAVICTFIKQTYPTAC